MLVSSVRIFSRKLMCPASTRCSTSTLTSFKIVIQWKRPSCVSHKPLPYKLVIAYGRSSKVILTVKRWRGSWCYLKSCYSWKQAILVIGSDLVWYVMHQSFETPLPPPSHFGNTRGIYFYFQWNAVKVRPCRENFWENAYLLSKQNSLNRF